MVAQSWVTYNKKNGGTPTLLQTLTEVLKYVSHNPPLLTLLGAKENFPLVEQMKLTVIGLDFDNVKFNGADGKKLHLMAY